MTEEDAKTFLCLDPSADDPRIKPLLERAKEICQGIKNTPPELTRSCILYAISYLYCNPETDNSDLILALKSIRTKHP